jgi:hypothetical protein
VLTELPPRQVPPRRLAALPQNYVIIQLTDVPPEAAAAAAAAQQQQQQQQQGCAAGSGGEDGGGAGPHGDPGPGYEVVVEAQLPDGTVSRMEAMLADFGPAFEPGCGEADAATRHAAASGDGAGGSPPAPELAAWRGRRVEVLEGGAAGQRYRLLYIADPAEGSLAVEEEDDDPYEDPDDLGEGEHHQRPQQQQQEQRQAQQQQQQQQQARPRGCSGREEGGGGEGEEAALHCGSGGVAASLPGPASGGGAAAAFPPAVLCAAEAEAAAAQPLHACSQLLNAAELAGRIAVVQRGG